MSDLIGFHSKMNGSRSDPDRVCRGSSLDPQSGSVPDPLRCASGLRSGPGSYLRGRSVPDLFAMWDMAAEISKALLNEARVRNFDNFTPISMSNNYWYYRLFVVVAVDVLDI